MGRLRYSSRFDFLFNDDYSDMISKNSSRHTNVTNILDMCKINEIVTPEAVFFVSGGYI